jgi:curved DNA-binding protein
MAFIDYYKILGIKKKSTQDEIKKAYRKLARKHHPDLNPNDKVAEQKFKEINEANEVLSNPENRKKYDKYGKDWEHGEEYEKARRQHQQSQGQYSRQDFSNKDYSDFFESMFGGERTSYNQDRTPKFKGQDFNAQLRLNLKDVYTNQQQVLTINNQKIRLTIPAGVENGQVIKIKGKGGLGINGGPNGDLYIKFIIDNHTQFKRDKNNLYATVYIDLYKAVLGGDLTIDTFDGKVKLKVKPETQNGTKIKLKGKGFPIYKKKGEFGDLIITYNIELPTKLTEKEKELFNELAKLRSI